MGTISGLGSQESSDSQSCAYPGSKQEHVFLCVCSWNLTKGHIKDAGAYIW